MLTFDCPVSPETFFLVDAISFGRDPLTLEFSRLTGAIAVRGGMVGVFTMGFLRSS